MVTAELTKASGLLQRLRALEAVVPGSDRAQLREALAGAACDLDAACGPEAVDAALGLCRSLYAQARSGEALPLARAALEAAHAIGQPLLLRRAATACGILSADAMDLVGAIEYHVLALRTATAAGDEVEAGRAWNSMGLAMGISGHYELAGRCYRRSIELVEGHEGPVHGRYAALSNLAIALHRLGEPKEGLAFAEAALAEETDLFRAQDPWAALLLRRNLVSLLAACGRAADAQPAMAECAELAERARNPRARIAAATTRATYELAMGQTDVALTRLEEALARARELPAALRDTLAIVVRAEEAAGNVQRALARLGELSDHIYRYAVERAREHVELAAIAPAPGTRLERDGEQARARLAARTRPPAAPDAWPALNRLAVSAGMRMDHGGRHGKRVGALVKAIALASGCEPLQALEMGLAAELHDIGMHSVPDGILGKRAGLNAAERAIVRRHVEAGAEMLRDDGDARVFTAREVARYHHARWDGEGYPEGVGGRRIPLAARACAVADAYDAMVCGLSGRLPRSMDDALAELHAESGGQFDPQLVDCFDNLIRTQTEDLGMDLATSPGMDGFHSLVSALQEDRGFV